MKITVARVFPALVLAMLAGGCAKGPPPNFYRLSPMAPEVLPGFEQGVTIGVGPVVLPAHLDRNQIVRSATATRLALSETDQWAEPLKSGVTRVLLVSIGLALDSNRIYALPLSQRRPLDYQVAVDVLRLDGRAGEGVLLAARSTVLAGEGKKVLVSKVSVIREPVVSPDTDALVQAQSRAIARLGEEIAALIRDRSS